MCYNIIIVKKEVIAMSLDELKQLDPDVEEKLLKSEEDIKNGRARDAVEVFKEFKEKYGF